MPSLTIAYSTPTPGSPDRRRAIAGLVGDLGERLLGKKRALTAITVTEVAADDWFVGGHSLAELGQASHRVVIRVTEGTNTKAEKARFIAETHRALARLLGPTRPESYVIVEEVRADAWGFGGETQERRAVADVLARDEEQAVVLDAYRRFGIR